MNLHELFIDELKDLHSAENQLVKALPKMVKAAVSPDLQKAFSGHLEETKNHVSRIQRAFESVSIKPRAMLCKGMQGLVEEGKEHIEKGAGDVFGDLALIGAGERVEHYEIAAYTSAISLAKTLKYSEAAELLAQTLGEEQKASKLLYVLAQPMLREASAQSARN
jgi:ferritin-like metal-binding protein YciE